MTKNRSKIKAIKSEKRCFLNLKTEAVSLEKSHKMDTLLDPALLWMEEDFHWMGKIIIISSEYLGKIDNPFNRQLLIDFLQALTIKSNQPDKIIFYAEGVKVLAQTLEENSQTEKILGSFGKINIKMIACQDSLAYYQVKSSLPIEKMRIKDITQAMMQGKQVIHP